MMGYQWIFCLVDLLLCSNDECDNVVQYIPTRDKRPKSESELTVQTTMLLAKIKTLEWVERIKVFFIFNYFKSKSLLFN